MPKSHIFIIDINGKDEAFICLDSVDLNLACMMVHRQLRIKYPDLFSDDWEDLLHDIEEGIQTCYGPLTMTTIE